MALINCKEYKKEISSKKESFSNYNFSEHSNRSLLQKCNILFFTIFLYLFGLTLTNVPSVFALDLDEDICPKHTRGADGSIQWLNPRPKKERISCYKSLARSLQGELEATPRIGDRHILKRQSTMFKSFPLINCESEKCWEKAMNIENAK